MFLVLVLSSIMFLCSASEIQIDAELENSLLYDVLFKSLKDEGLFPGRVTALSCDALKDRLLRLVSLLEKVLTEEGKEVLAMIVQEDRPACDLPMAVSDFGMYCALLCGSFGVAEHLYCPLSKTSSVHRVHTIVPSVFCLAIQKKADQIAQMLFQDVRTILTDRTELRNYAAMLLPVFFSHDAQEILSTVVDVLGENSSISLDEKELIIGAFTGNVDVIYRFNSMPGSVNLMKAVLIGVSIHEHHDEDALVQGICEKLQKYSKHKLSLERSDLRHMLIQRSRAIGNEKIAHFLEEEIVDYNSLSNFFSSDLLRGIFILTDYLVKGWN